MYIYANFINPDSGGGGAPDPVEYQGGVRSNAYLDGEVLDVRTHGEFTTLLKQHEEDTGLPVVVDFTSQVDSTFLVTIS